MKKWYEITELKAGLWMCSITIVLMIIVMCFLIDTIEQKRAASKIEQAASQYVYETDQAKKLFRSDLKQFLLDLKAIRANDLELVEANRQNKVRGEMIAYLLKEIKDMNYYREKDRLVIKKAVK